MLFDGLASPSDEVGEHEAWWGHDVARQVRAWFGFGRLGSCALFNGLVLARVDVDDALCGVVTT